MQVSFAVSVPRTPFAEATRFAETARLAGLPRPLASPSSAGVRRCWAGINLRSAGEQEPRYGPDINQAYATGEHTAWRWLPRGRKRATGKARGWRAGGLSAGLSPPCEPSVFLAGMNSRAIAVLRKRAQSATVRKTGGLRQSAFGRLDHRQLRPLRSSLCLCEWKKAAGCTSLPRRARWALLTRCLQLVKKQLEVRLPARTGGMLPCQPASASHPRSMQSAGTAEPSTCQSHREHAE